MFILAFSHTIRIGHSLSNYIGPFDSINEAYNWYKKHIENKPEYKHVCVTVESLLL